MFEREEPYWLLFEKHPFPMWVFDFETLSFLQVNRAAIRHYGYSRGEFLAMTIKDLHPADEVSALLDSIRKMAAGQEPRSINAGGAWRHRKKDGSLIDVRLVQCRLSFDQQSAGLVLARDITKRERADKAVQVMPSRWSCARKAIYLASMAIENTRLVEQIRRCRERLQALSRRVLDAQESERRVLALELHDEIGQALTVVKMNLRAIQGSIKSPTVAPHLADSMSVIDEAIQRVRNLSLDLRPSLLDDFGLAPALRWLVERQTKQAGIAIHFKADSCEGRLPSNCEIACFRIAQEALTNIVRHAQARQVWVELRKNKHGLCLLIRDDGVGFDVAASLERASHGTSVGLLGMQERATLVGGTVTIRSRPLYGTEIRLHVPLDRSFQSTFKNIKHDRFQNLVFMVEQSIQLVRSHPR